MHKSRPIKFILVVDDFGIEYEDEADVHHLIACLEELYVLKVDWSGQKYIGYDIQFSPASETQPRGVTLSMPRYIPNAMIRFGITVPTPLIHNPAPPTYMNYSEASLTAVPDTSPLLDDRDIKRV